MLVYQRVFLWPRVFQSVSLVECCPKVLGMLSVFDWSEMKESHLMKIQRIQQDHRKDIEKTWVWVNTY
jgi:hypothetical protein